MGRRAEPERIRHAMMTGAVMALRDRIRLDTEGRFGRLRSKWPELTERIEDATSLIDWD